MLTTLLRPTAGTATVAGADLLADPVGVRRRIGYVAQAIGATGGGSDPNAKVGEEITLQAELYRVPRAEIADRTERLTRRLGESQAGPLGTDLCVHCLRAGDGPRHQRRSQPRPARSSSNNGPECRVRHGWSRP